MPEVINAFLSVYACEPGKGSEPEVGWQVAMGMAHECNIRAVTRENNRESIEAALQGIAGPKPEFLYYDLPPIFLWLKKKILGTSGYYILWQIAVRWIFRKELRHADLVHHVTFNGVQFPGFWIATGKPVILGPLGGGMTCPTSLLPLIADGRRREKARSLLLHSLRFIPWWRFIISKAAVVIAANRETAELLQPFRRAEVPIMLETAVSPEAIQSEPRHRLPENPLNVLWLGHLIPRKAPVLAIRALALALKTDPGIALVIAGGGPEEARLRDEVARLGIGNQVRFLGRVPKAEVNTLMDAADAFLFTSIRDTSGNVVLEAMSRALPVVTLWHQGIREICDSDCALVVKPSGIEGTTADIAKALIRLKQEDGLAARVGEAGQKQIAARHMWTCYRSRMLKIYQAAVGN